MLAIFIHWISGVYTRYGEYSILWPDEESGVVFLWPLGTRVCRGPIKWEILLLSFKSFLESLHRGTCWTGFSVSLKSYIHRHIIVLQVPSRYTAENPIENLKQFKTEVPVLGLLGTPVAIEHNSNFDVTDDVQLVCKYLKACETKRIDKLFTEGK